jgi:hypothetical protein
MLQSPQATTLLNTSLELKPVQHLTPSTVADWRPSPSGCRMVVKSLLARFGEHWPGVLN